MLGSHWVPRTAPILKQMSSSKTFLIMMGLIMEQGFTKDLKKFMAMEILDKRGASVILQGQLAAYKLY